MVLRGLNHATFFKDFYCLSALSHTNNRTQQRVAGSCIGPFFLSTLCPLKVNFAVYGIICKNMAAPTLPTTGQSFQCVMIVAANVANEPEVQNIIISCSPLSWSHILWMGFGVFKAWCVFSMSLPAEVHWVEGGRSFFSPHWSCRCTCRRLAISACWPALLSTRPAARWFLPVRCGVWCNLIHLLELC